MVRKRLRILLALALLAIIVGGIVWQLLPLNAPEPLYHGVPLSVWLEGTPFCARSIISILHSAIMPFPRSAASTLNPVSWCPP